MIWDSIRDAFDTGICPWDGSHYSDGRDFNSHQRRHCLRCGATFSQLCPECKGIDKSLGFNAGLSQYGCDRCGAIFDSAMNFIKKVPLIKR